MNQHIRYVLGLAVASLALGACSTTHYVSIRHPLQVGQVDPNIVPFEARREQRPRSLPPGTLVDQAELTELTPERVCLRTSLWSLDEVNATRGDYQGYRMALLNDQEGLENTTGEVQLGAPVTQAYQGTIQRRVQAGWRSVCTARRNRRCVRRRRRRVYRTVSFPHVWSVTTHPANVCFANGGFVTAATTRVALEVDGSGPGRMVFEWQLESAVQGAAQ